eukprot:UN28083
MITARGVTDCLGHVCLLSSMMKTLSEDSENPSLNVICIFVGGHENVFDSQIGVTQLLETGKLDKVKNGPIYWVSGAEFGPPTASLGSIGFKLEIVGKKGHSSVTEDTINT